MRHRSRFRFSHTVQLLTAAFLIAVPLPAFGHEAGETIPDPGFRPDSEHALAFLDVLENTSVAVHPTILRRENRTAHSFASQKQIIAALSEAKMASIVSGSLRIDLGRLPPVSQWEMFQNSMDRIAEKLRDRQAVAEYHLFTELLFPVDHTIFGIQCYVLDNNGENAFSFLLNSHHRIFADARLTATGKSLAARNELTTKATQLAVTALMAQVEAARERAALAPIVVPEKVQTGNFDDVELHAMPDTEGAFLNETPIDETSSILSFAEGDVGQGSAKDKSMNLMCQCADLALMKGYRYFGTEDPREEGDRRMRFKISFYHDPPQGLSTLSASKDLNFEATPGTFVLDAEELTPYCAVWKIAQADSVAANRPDTRTIAPGKRSSFNEKLCKDAANVEYPINELPMYGYAQKTREQEQADQRYIGTMTRGGATREDAAEYAARLGWNYYYGANCTSAIRRFNQAWLLDPNNRHALWGFAVISLERGKIEEATRYFQLAIEAGPEDPSLQQDYETALAMLDQRSR